MDCQARGTKVRIIHHRERQYRRNTNCFRQYRYHREGVASCLIDTHIPRIGLSGLLLISSIPSFHSNGAWPYFIRLAYQVVDLSSLPA
jgi:hypothetical protein